MPVPLLRNGNIMIEKASFSKTHGATPTQCQVMYEAISNQTLWSPLVIDIGGSVWSGNIVEASTHTSEAVGQVTELKCHDTREALMSQCTYCMLNMIDRKTGQIYCILDDNFIDALVALNYITQAQADANYGSWQTLTAFDVWAYLYPQTIINVLLYLVGFTANFSTAAQMVLANADNVLDDPSSALLNSSVNLFGIDWFTGNKVGATLTHIAELLGLQFTIAPDDSEALFVKGGPIPCKPRY